MKSEFQGNGLSARRKTIHKIKDLFFWLRNRFGLLIILALILSSCHEKTNGQTSANAEKDQVAAAQDSLNKPKVSIQVNRRYDDKGNMIGFDSTYSSFYSNAGRDTASMDSLMHRFDSYFNRQHSTFFRNEFNPLFFNDSLRYPDFFHHDFFLRRYELNDPYLRGMMQRMDSIKNQFYEEQSKNRNDKKNSKDL
jgi:hypothetical protein